MMYRPAGVPVSFNFNVVEDNETVALQSEHAKEETFFKLSAHSEASLQLIKSRCIAKDINYRTRIEQGFSNIT